jgi:hypothetical protein
LDEIAMTTFLSEQGGLVASREHGFTDLDGSQPDAWRYVVEVQDAGRQADVTGYH